MELTSTPVGSIGPTQRGGSEPLEAVLAQAATGLIKVCMGQHTEAHQRLSLALRAAHGRLMHHSLVSSCMAFLIPLQLRMGDVAAAESMVASAHLLAHGSKRTMCQLHSLLEDVSKEKSLGERAQKARTDQQREATQLQAQITEAQTSDAPSHACILQFGLQQC